MAKRAFLIRFFRRAHCVRQYIIYSHLQGTLMRYFLSLALPIALLAKGALQATSTAGSVFSAGATQALSPGRLGTTAGTIQIATITVATDQYLTMATGTGIDSGASFHRHQALGADENWTWREYSETLYPSCENTVSGMASGLTVKS